MVKKKLWNVLLWTLLCVNAAGLLFKAIWFGAQGTFELFLTGLVLYIPAIFGVVMALLGGGWGWLLFSLFFNLGAGVDGPLVIHTSFALSLPVPLISFALTVALLIVRGRMPTEERAALKQSAQKRMRVAAAIGCTIAFALYLVWLLVLSGGSRRVTPVTKYYGPCEQAGTVERIDYDSFVYDMDGTPGDAMPKYAYVYLPCGYDRERQYNILYLSHGGGGAAENWLIEIERDKNMIDHMIANGEIEPLIIVTPTFYQYNDLTRTGSIAVNLTEIFRYELRNDLIPAVEAKYATYAGGDVSIPGLVASRDHRAFAGLSMGSMTTWASALCGNLDFFSWFGPYSAGGDAEKVLATIHDPANADYPIHYIYNANGTADMAFIGHKQMYNTLLSDPYFTEGENIEFTTLHLYMHDWPAWTIDLYNTLLVFFRD